MIILNETNKPYIVDSLTTPIVLRHHWIFDAHQLDFCLQEITYLEETVGPTITLSIGDAEVRIPGGWNILITDLETYTVDAVPVTACAAFEHHAFVFSPNDGKLITAPIRVMNWESTGTCTYPSIEKAQGMVHAVSNGFLHGKSIPRGVILSPHDLWRWVGGKTVGDLLG